MDFYQELKPLEQEELGIPAGKYAPLIQAPTLRRGRFTLGVMDQWTTLRLEVWTLQLHEADY